MNTSELRIAVQSEPGEFRLQVAHTSELAPAVLARARALLDEVFEGEMTPLDWEHALGGMHAIAWRATSVIGHASVIQRRLVHGGHALRTGYVEGVGVHRDWQRHGIGGQMMGALEQIIETSYDIGALGATDEAVSLYEHRGWIKWAGHTAAMTPTGIVGTPDDDGCVYVLALGRSLEFVDDLICDWRDGDAW